MGVLDRLFGLDKLVDAKVAERTTELGKTITQHLDGELSKASSSPTSMGVKGAKRYAVNQVPNNTSLTTKPGTTISFKVLREFAIKHEISRAAINYRKRQMAKLDWDIVAAEHDQTSANAEEVAAAKLFFKRVGGAGNKYRKFLAKTIEDLLVLDAVAIEKQRTVGGKLLDLIPLDASTIQLRVDESGATPLPPEIAYRQIIRGQVVAEFTTLDMVYDMMNPRTDTPYGLAPLESLMIVVSSSLKAGLYNLSYLTDGNIPEGFFGVPKEWTPNMIKDFQENWDAVMAGDAQATSKLKFTPEGSYTPAKKQGDMAWEMFNDWLMKVTCALFDVQPSEIGFHPNKGGLGGAGMAQQSSQTSDEKGLLPLAAFIEEIFTEIIQDELGFTDLAFHFTGLDQDKDAQIEAEVNGTLIATGQRTINEIRTDAGLKKDPSPQADQLMIVSGTPTFLESQEDIDAGKAMAANIAAGKNPDGSDLAPAETPAATPAAEAETPPPDNTEKMMGLVTEFRRFKKMAIARSKAEKSFRPFSSDLIPQNVLDELNAQIAKAKDTEAIRGIFGDFMQDYQIDFIAEVVELQGNLQKILR